MPKIEQYHRSAQGLLLLNIGRPVVELILKKSTKDPDFAKGQAPYSYGTI